MRSIRDKMLNLKGDFDRTLFSEMFVRLMADGHDCDLHYVFLLIFNSLHLSVVHVEPVRTISDNN